MISPIVVYLGPSMLDGAPIVVLASTGSSNVKTGPLVQTWILRADVAPHTAGHAGKDASVCGTCPRRRSLGGDCYVTIHQAPLSAWKAWDRAGKLGENWSDPAAILRLQGDALAHGLRLGSYGDPAAVPHTVWADLIDALQPRMVVGYTHQWRALEAAGLRSDRAAWFRRNLMASADSPQDALDARSLGWRYFLAVPTSLPASAIPERTIECPATVSDRQCADCGACDGSARGAGKASVFLREHGAMSSAKARRSSALKVIPSNDEIARRICGA